MPRPLRWALTGYAVMMGALVGGAYVEWEWRQHTLRRLAATTPRPVSAGMLTTNRHPA